jgi:Ca-activated chloride channel family protein
VDWATTFDFPERERENAFVPRLWATQRIGWLSAEKRRDGANAEIDAEIRELGERYGIPTEFTSYFVKEPGVMADASGNIVGQTSGGGVRREMAVGRGMAVPPSVAAPREQQFKAAKASQEQRAAVSLQSLDAMEKDQAAANGVEMRRAGTRMFQRVDGIWTDVRVAPDMKRVKVKAYSAAYFALAESLTGLRESLALGEKVVVAGRAVAIEVTDTGAETLSERELESVRSNW